MSVVPPVLPWDGALTLTPGAVLYRGTGGDADVHAHHAVQVVVSLDEPFLLELDGDVRHTSAVVVPSGVPHRLRCSSRNLLLMLVEPFGPRGRGLDLVGKHCRAGEFDHALVRAVAERSDESNPVAAIDRLIRVVTPEAPQRPAALSESVRSALRYLERNSGSRPTLAQAAAEAHISPSRLTHTFTREMGIPFRRYVVWVRLRNAAEHVAQGDNLTQAAVAAGFSDSSHLSRVFKSNFGLSPSALLRMKLDRDAWPEGHS